MFDPFRRAFALAAEFLKRFYRRHVILVIAAAPRTADKNGVRTRDSAVNRKEPDAIAISFQLSSRIPEMNDSARVT